MVRPQVRAPLGDALPQPQQVAPAALPPVRASLMDRIRAGGTQLSSALFPTPEGLNGLLSDEDIGAARKQGLLSLGLGLLEQGGPHVGPRVSLGQAFARALGGAQQAQQSSLGNAVQTQTALMQRMGLVKQQQLEEMRAKIAAKYPIPQGASQEQIANALRGMLADFVRIGDTEMVAKLNSVAPSLFASGAAGQKPQWEDFGGYKGLMSPDGRELARVAKTPSPRDPNAPDTATQLRDQRMFARQQQLTDDFNKDTKPARDTSVKLQGAISEAPRAKAGDGASQINILYAFVSAMDPASAVREGEIGLAQAATPVWQQASSLFQKYLNNESVAVPAGMVDRMVNLMQRRLEGYGKYVDSRSEYYGQRAKRWGVYEDGLFPGLGVTPIAAPAPNAQGNADNVRKWLSPR